MHSPFSAAIADKPLRPFQWLVMGGALIVLVIEGIDLQSLPIVTPLILEEWGIDRALFGPALAAALFGMAFGSSLGGWLGDRWGRLKALYLAALIFPTCLYMASGVLVPRIPPEGTFTGKFDLQVKYEANRRWFFGFCIVGLLALIFYDHLVAGVPWSQVTDTLTRPDNYYRLAGLGILGLLFCVGGWFHGLLTLVAVVTLAAFITAKTLGW